MLTRCAAKFYNTFKVPTMILDASKKKRKYSSEDKTDLDITCDNDNIGVIVNLSQEINTIMWDRVNRTGNWPWAMEAYMDNCLLSILSSAAIDSTKREYPINFMEELRLVRSRYNAKDKDGRDIRPSFFAHVARKKGYYDPSRKYYMAQMAPMDYLQEVVDKHKMRGKKAPKVLFTIGDFIKEFPVEEAPRQGYVDLILAMIGEMDAKIRSLYQVRSDVIADNIEKRELANKYFNKCIDSIRNMHLTDATIKELLIQMDNPENAKIRRRLWMIIFGSLDFEVNSLFDKIKSPVHSLEECHVEDADVFLYNVPFKRRIVA